MKLKKKLANIIAVEIGPESLMDCARLEKAALLGFEKARQMACDIEWNAAGNSEQLHKFKSLGEQEVKE